MEFIPYTLAISIPSILKGMTDLLPASVLPSLEPVSRVAATIFITTLWQSAALTGFVAICLKLAPRTSAALRFRLWLATFALLACLPMLPFVSALTASEPTLIANATASSARPWFHLEIGWGLVISALWAAASLYRTVDLGTHLVRLRRLWKSATPVPSLAEFAITGERTAQLCTTHDLDRPSVIGFFAPRILIPEWLYAKLTPSELNQVVLHETEHLHRSDDWTNLLQKLGLVLFPLNPALLWVERHLCVEREIACDDGVIRITNSPRAYAACLASLAERGLQRQSEALSLGAWHRRPELVQRVHHLLVQTRSLGPVANRLLLATVGCSLLVGAIAFSRCPELVAFEPSHPAPSPQLSADNSLPAPAQLIRTGYISHGEFAPILEEHQHHTRQINTAASAKGPVSSRPSTATQASSLPTDSVIGSHPAYPLESAVSFAETASLSSSNQAEQWIVLTTWEQVPAKPAASATAARTQDSPAQDATPIQSANIDTVPQPTAYRTTVTRLVMRIVPASFVTPTSPASPTRSGWIFFQL